MGRPENEKIFIVNEEKYYFNKEKLNDLIQSKKKRALKLNISDICQNIANETCMSVESVRRWRNGKSYPDKESLEGISSYFNIDIIELLSPLEEGFEKKINHVKIKEDYLMKFEVKSKRLDILDVNGKDNQFRINIDVLNECFGANRSMFCKACYPDRKGETFSGADPKDRYFVWMPKLYGNSSGWKNILSDDGQYIYEIGTEGKNEDWTEDERNETIYSKNRLVFVKTSASQPYKFVGVFIPEKMDYLHHTYKRVATRIQLVGNPVNQIIILEN